MVTFKLHIGADAENSMELKRFGISAKALELTDTSVLSADQSLLAQANHSADGVMSLL